MINALDSDIKCISAIKVCTEEVLNRCVRNGRKYKEIGIYHMCTYTAVRSGCLSCRRQIWHLNAPPTPSLRPHALFHLITDCTILNTIITIPHEHVKNNSDSLPSICSALFIIWCTKSFETFSQFPIKVDDQWDYRLILWTPVCTSPDLPLDIGFYD